MRSALVTGANGFLGSHLVDDLVARDYRVKCMVRPTADRRWVTHQVEWIEADLPRGAQGAREALAGVDVVFHVAGVVKALTAQEYHRVNAQLVEDMLALCLEADPPPKRFVLISSLAASGPAAPGRLVDEAQPCRPVSLYGRSKREGELRALAAASRIKVVIVRPGGIYGPRDTESLKLFQAARLGVMPAPGGRDQLFNFAHVADIVQIVSLAGEAEVESGEIFMAGARENHTAEEIGRAIGQAMGRKVVCLGVPWPLVYAAGLAAEAYQRVTQRPGVFSWQKVPEVLQKNWGIDVGKAMTLLGYAPRCPLTKGTVGTAGWYRRQGLL